MMDTWRRETEPLVFLGGIHMPYSWTVGRVGSRFFIELRDNGRIMGNKCQKCNVIWVPPRLRCPECFIKIDENNWLEVGPQGTLKHFTIVRYESPVHPIKSPFAYGLIHLDRADRGIVHLIGETTFESLRSGMRVKPVFKNQREGNILDILYFKPVEE